MASASPKLTSRVLFLHSLPHCQKLPLFLPLLRLTIAPVNPLPLISSPISLRKITCKATEVSVAEDKGGRGRVSDEERKNWVLVVPVTDMIFLENNVAVRGEIGKNALPRQLIDAKSVGKDEGSLVSADDPNIQSFQEALTHF
ncbi:hypothetical protein LOK49_LG04G02795 [Camellia lanceoleosa]|uniref:Uncharacterized protein n=1 Tax=Camellia lanceoleosa TaxID=1840588 RepID=A0ACC0HZL3_9ERIC|nr:hypothetical protein LOK49_LG04G02795 [Camellia lanceoleosa]